MDTNRYYFSNFIENDILSVLAVQAKDLIQQNDHIVTIFQNNNELLYGSSPKQILFLMKQNNKTIFSSSPSSENNPIDAQSHQGSSTPVSRNLNILNIRRRHLSADDAKKKVHPSFMLEPGNIVRRPTVITSCKNEAILNPTIDEADTRDEQLFSSTDSIDSLEAGYQESPRSAEVAKITANLTMAEKELGSPAKVTSSIDSNSQESPRSSEVFMMTANLALADKEFGSTNLGDQESPRYTEITSKASNIAVDKESRSQIQDWQIAGSSATNTDSFNLEEYAEESGNTDSNQDSISQAEGMDKIAIQTKVVNKTPSPAKRSLATAFDIKEFTSPEKARMTDSSPKYTEEIASPIPDDKMNKSPNESYIEFSRDEKKRKSLSPTNKDQRIFRSIPRIILIGGEKIAIEVPSDLEENAHLATSQSSSADYRSGSKKDNIGSPVVNETKTETSPMIFKKYLPSSEGEILTGNVSGTNSPESGENVFAGKCSSSIPSLKTTETRSRFCKSESDSADIETDPFSLKNKILQFNTLTFFRDHTVAKLFCSLLSFQNGLQFLSAYVHNLAHIVAMIGIADQENLTKETVDEASAIALKLKSKIKSWETNVEFDVNTWNKYLLQIQHLKAQYEPLLTRDGNPMVTFEVVQSYESEIKVIWKRIDEIVMLGDSRRALFSHISHDLVKLMKMFINCLILVGILQPH